MTWKQKWSFNIRHEKCIYFFDCCHARMWKDIYIHINMQIAHVPLWSPHSTYYNLRDKYLLPQTIWTDMNANLSH